MKKLLVVFALLVLNAASYGTMWGQEVIARSEVDQAYSITFINTSVLAPVSGKISQWYLYADAGMYDHDVKLQVFRPVAGGYQLIGQNSFTLSTSGYTTLPVAAAEQINIQAGDLLGFRYNGPNNQVKRSIVFSYSGSGKGYMYSTQWPNANHDVAVGGVISSAELDNNNKDRVYSLSAEIVPEPATIAILGLGILRLRRKNKE